MSPTKRALLIASPYGGLRGPVNDGEKMAAVLEKLGFEIRKCYGDDATHAGIWRAWETLIEDTTVDDAVVVYYSGHGGLVTSQIHPDPEKHAESEATPWRYQFLVPVDFDETEPDDFRGITEVEISYLLKETTNRTHNVTVILDCCHAGRMAREPSFGGQATPKSLLNVQYCDVERNIKKIARRKVNAPGGEEYLEGNPHAVRIAAAAVFETAWEYPDANDQWTGALTDALAKALEEAQSHQISWRITMLRVREIVNAKFPMQHPQAEGPETRLHFSTELGVSAALQLKIQDDMPVIQAGSIAGVREGNIYSVVPFRSVTETSSAEIAEAHVTFVNGFEALVDLKYVGEETPLPPEGALAYPKSEALNPWPIEVDFEPPPILEEHIRASQHIRLCTPEEKDMVIGMIKHAGTRMTFQTRLGTEIAALEVGEASGPVNYRKIIDAAERLARAQHLLALQTSADERLQHSVDVQVGLVVSGKRDRIIRPRGDDQLEKGSKLHITLKNDGEHPVYATVLDVNVAGEISLVSNSSPQGIELLPGRSYTIGANRLGVLKGLSLSWPAHVPQDQPVHERLIVILTCAPISLWHLADPSRPRTTRNRSLSSLEKLTMQISYGGSRDIRQESDVDGIFYDIIHVPFTLWPPVVSSEQSLLAADMATLSVDGNPSNTADGTSEHQAAVSPTKLPPPELVTDKLDIPSLPPGLDPAPKGVISGIIRAYQKVPPCVWVVNQHTEEITVVVSKYRPNRILTEGGINASFPAAGANLSATVGLPILLPYKRTKLLTPTTTDLPKPRHEENSHTAGP
jgi:hypothetical protein